MKHLSNTFHAEFNQPETVLVISKYPYQDVEPSYHGVATYTQHTLRAISKETGLKFVVLVQDEYDRPVEKDGENILVVPAFSTGIKMFPQLVAAVRTFSQIKKVHIHSEFYTSGEALQMALVVPFLATLKLMGRELSYIAHNVVDDFSFIATHLGKKTTDFSLQVLEKLTPSYYWSLSHAVKEVVVLDESVRQRMRKFVHDDKLVTTPHWIHPKPVAAGVRSRMRKKLGFAADDVVLVCFGFMTSYKGVDWLVDAVQHTRRFKAGKQVKLVLAGGKSPSQAGKAHYERFYTQLAQKVAKSTSMILTGFIPEEKLEEYFAIADIVVLPYRGILGASGSWAQAMAHGKPFLISEDLQAYLQSHDVLAACREFEVAPYELVFKRHKGVFAKKVLDLIKQPHKLKNIAKVSKEIGQDRSPETRIPLEYHRLYTSQPSRLSLQLTYVAETVKKLYSNLVP